MAMKKDGSQTGIPVLSIKSNLTPVSYDTSTASSAVAEAGGAVCRIVATTDCHVEVGSAPTATTNSAFLPANAIDYVLVPNGEKIAAIKSATAGSLYITIVE